MLDQYGQVRNPSVSEQVQIVEQTLLWTKMRVCPSI